MAETLAAPLPFSLIVQTVVAVGILFALGVWLVNRRKAD
jgi:hypothetical protein